MKNSQKSSAVFYWNFTLQPECLEKNRQRAPHRPLHRPQTALPRKSIWMRTLILTEEFTKGKQIWVSFSVLAIPQRRNRHAFPPVFNLYLKPHGNSWDFPPLLMLCFRVFTPLLLNNQLDVWNENGICNQDCISVFCIQIANEKSSGTRLAFDNAVLIVHDTRHCDCRRLSKKMILRIWNFGIFLYRI